MQLLMGWRSLRMCGVRSVSIDWRNSNPISLRKLVRQIIIGLWYLNNVCEPRNINWHRERISILFYLFLTNYSVNQNFQMTDFPFDSGWIQVQAPIRMKATLASQLVDRVQRKHNTSSIAIPKAPPRLKLLADFFGK